MGGHILGYANLCPKKPLFLVAKRTPKFCRAHLTKKTQCKKGHNLGLSWFRASRNKHVLPNARMESRTGNFGIVCLALGNNGVFEYPKLCPPTIGFFAVLREFTSQNKTIFFCHWSTSQTTRCQSDRPIRRTKMENIWKLENSQILQNIKSGSVTQGSPSRPSQVDDWFLPRPKPWPRRITWLLPNGSQSLAQPTCRLVMVWAEIPARV